MAIPSWPDGLPYASQVGDYAMSQLANPPLRSDMNSGTTRQRRKYTMRIAIQKLGIVMSADETQVFHAFHADTLGDGAARFTMPVWNGSAYVNRTVAIKDGPSETQFAVGQNKIALTLMIENL